MQEYAQMSEVRATGTLDSTLVPRLGVLHLVHERRTYNRLPSVFIDDFSPVAFFCFGT